MEFCLQRVGFIYWALSILYCTWLATNPKSDLVTPNTVLLYIYIYIYSVCVCVCVRVYVFIRIYIYIVCMYTRIYSMHLVNCNKLGKNEKPVSLYQIYVLNRATHIIIKGNAFLVVRRLDVKGDIVAETVFSSVCGMLQSPIARHKVFQQPPFRFRSALPLPDTWYGSPWWVWGNVGKWMEA